MWNWRVRTRDGASHFVAVRADGKTVVSTKWRDIGEVVRDREVVEVTQVPPRE